MNYRPVGPKMVGRMKPAKFFSKFEFEVETFSGQFYLTEEIGYLTSIVKTIEQRTAPTDALFHPGNVTEA